MQAALVLCRVVKGTPTAVRASELYDATTIAGADALGRPDLGRLAPGCAADIAVFRLDSVHVGPVQDPIQPLFTGGSGRDVRDVWIAGRHVVQDGVLPGFDLPDAHARAQAQFERLVAQYPDRTWKHPPLEAIFPPSHPVRGSDMTIAPRPS